MDRTVGNLVIVRIDGGICSQINFFAYGHALQKMLGDKVNVKYDLSWFREDGRDYFGRFVRNWDFPKAFPDLPIEEATQEEIAAVRKRRTLDFSELSTLEVISAPAYLGGYPKMCFNLPGCRQMLVEKFNPALDAESAAVADEIAKGPACAIHVRRGDLSEYSVAYGQPCSNEYFAKAIKIVKGLEPRARFYFFSDEPDYVRKELLPVLPPDLDGRIVVGNGSDKGYMDLALISKCSHVIASIGSLGVFGAFLGGGTLVSPRCRLEYFKSMDGVIYLNEDRQQIANPPQREDRQRLFPGVVRIRRGKNRALLLFDRVKIAYRGTVA